MSLFGIINTLVLSTLECTRDMGAGLGLAGIVTSVFADEGLSFALPIPALAIFTVVAIVAGMLAAILPARRASRLDVLDALAYE